MEISTKGSKSLVRLQRNVDHEQRQLKGKGYRERISLLSTVQIKRRRGWETGYYRRKGVEKDNRIRYFFSSYMKVSIFFFFFCLINNINRNELAQRSFIISVS